MFPGGKAVRIYKRAILMAKIRRMLLPALCENFELAAKKPIALSNRAIGIKLSRFT